LAQSRGAQHEAGDEADRDEVTHGRIVREPPAFKSKIPAAILIRDNESSTHQLESSAPRKREERKTR